MSLEDKIVEKDTAQEIVREWQGEGEKVVLTNGCFDLMHAGHVRYLERAKALGDRLVVGMNSDESVRQLKGPERPIQPEVDRAAILAALASVDLVIVYAEERALNLIDLIRPDIYVKGGDYTLETIYRPERDFVWSYGGVVEIVSLNGMNATASTSNLIKRIRERGTQA